jgi:hypothetical protein
LRSNLFDCVPPLPSAISIVLLCIDRRLPCTQIFRMGSSRRPRGIVCRRESQAGAPSPTYSGGVGNGWIDTSGSFKSSEGSSDLGRVLLSRPSSPSVNRFHAMTQRAGPMIPLQKLPIRIAVVAVMLVLLNAIAFWSGIAGGLTLSLSLDTTLDISTTTILTSKILTSTLRNTPSIAIMDQTNIPFHESSSSLASSLPPLFVAAACPAYAEQGCFNEDYTCESCCTLKHKMTQNEMISDLR